MFAQVTFWKALVAVVLAAAAAWFGGQQPNPFKPAPTAPAPAPPPPPPSLPPILMPEPPKPPAPNVAKAIARIQFGSAGCTATVIGPPREDRRWSVLTAAHCVGGVGQRGTMRMQDGQVLGIVCRARDPVADCAWCETEGTADALPFAMIAETTPPIGTRIWHAGYGIDKPGNREDGEVIGGIGDNGQIRMRLSVSSGDSGGAIVREDTGEVISCVCCTSGMARAATVWGAGPAAIRRLRPTPMTSDEWTPLPVPFRPDTGVAAADLRLDP